MRSGRRRTRSRRFFTRRQLVPPSVFTRITVSVPVTFRSNYVDSTIGALPSFDATFVLNSLADGTVGSSSPNGTYNFLTVARDGQTPGTDFSKPAQGRIYYGRQGVDVAAVEKNCISTNYYHLGNMFKTYKVTGALLSFTGGHALTPNTYYGGNSVFPISQPNFNGVCDFTLFATDDLDSCDTSQSRLYNYSRPEVFNTRHHAIKAVPSMNFGARPKHIKLKSSVKRLTRSVYPSTSMDYVGTCTPGVSGAVPVYNAPSKVVYHGFTYVPYGLNGVDVFSAPTARNQAFPQDYSCFTGYATCVYFVKFFDPHSNSDFVNPV